MTRERRKMAEVAAQQPTRADRLELTPELAEAGKSKTRSGARVERVAKRFQVKNVDLYYGSFHAVQGVSMTIEANQVTALIGSSGCGKTTMLRSLNRMHELTPGARVEGEVVLDEQ